MLSSTIWVNGSGRRCVQAGNFVIDGGFGIGFGMEVPGQVAVHFGDAAAAMMEMAQKRKCRPKFCRGIRSSPP